MLETEKKRKLLSRTKRDKMDVDVVGVLFWYFSLAFGAEILIKQILERLNDKFYSMKNGCRLLAFILFSILLQKVSLHLVAHDFYTIVNDKKTM